MRDREAINRFCAFYLLGEKNYKGMDNFLADVLDKMNTMPEIELENLKVAFEHSLKANEQLFEKHAFRKSLADSQYASRSVINIALFDVCSVLLAQYDILEKEEEIKETIQELVTHDDEFIHAISYSTNSTKQVLIRFRLARSAFEAILC